MIYLTQTERVSAVRGFSHTARDWLRKVRRSVREFFLIDQLVGAIRRWPAAVFLSAVFQAPADSRIRFLCRAPRSLRRPRSSAAAKVCAINSLAEFESGYVRLAMLLGHPGKTPPPAELEFLASIARRRKYYRGEIAPADHLFLTAMVSIVAPRRVIEIGTLAGFSAGMIAAALARQHGNDGAVWVDTIDIRAQCTADRSRPSGFEIAELFPEFASMIRLHIPADSSFVSKLAARDKFGLAFIDADHRHPLPLLDLLQLTPYLRDQSWIVLHDIKLGTMTRQAIEIGRKLERTPVFGAEWLFERWPFRKIRGGNIGAVQLPTDKGAVVAFALQLMSKPFEITEEHARIIRPALYESLRRPIL